MTSHSPYAATGGASGRIPAFVPPVAGPQMVPSTSPATATHLSGAFQPPAGMPPDPAAFGPGYGMPGMQQVQMGSPNGQQAYAPVRMQDGSIAYAPVTPQMINGRWQYVPGASPPGGANLPAISPGFVPGAIPGAVQSQV